MASFDAVSEGLARMALRIDMGDITDLIVSIWVEDLEEYSDEQVKLAMSHVQKHRKSSDFGRPLPGDVIAVIQEMNPNQRWSESFEWLRENVLSPYSGLPDFPDEITRKAFNEFGGVYAIVGMNTNDMGMHRAQYKQIYKDIESHEKMKTFKALNTHKAQNIFISGDNS